MNEKKQYLKLLNKPPNSRIKRDLYSLVIFIGLTLSIICLSLFLEYNSREIYLDNFDLEFLDSDQDTDVFGIIGSKYITKDMDLEFKCSIPKNTKNVWIKFNDDSEWILLPKTDNFLLTAKNINNYTLNLRCDNKITSFTTTIYQPDLPILEIDIDSNFSYHEEECKIEINPIDEQFKYHTAKYSWAYSKLNAKIKLRNSDNGFEFELGEKKSLLNMRYDDDWILLPSREYASALRIKLAHDVYNSLGKMNPLCRLPNAEPVDLFVNGKYIGLYLLLERPDEKLFELNTSLVKNSQLSDMLFKGEDWKGDGKNGWNQIFPDNIKMEEYPIQLDHFIRTASDNSFVDNESGIYSLIDRNQIIDFLLFGLIVGHDSLEGSKFYLIRNENLSSRYYFAPWDFDTSWGYSRNSIYHIDDWIFISPDISNFCKWNHLFYRLLFSNDFSFSKQLKIDILNRWKEIRESVWKEDFLGELYSSLFNYMKNGLIRNDENQNLYTINRRITNWIVKRCYNLDIISKNNKALNLYSNLPSIYIKTEEMELKKIYFNCNFELYQSFPYEEKTSTGKIKFRGSTNWNDAKPGYRIELSKKISLLGMRDDDDWYLFSMQQDIPRMRIKLAFDLWRSLSYTNPTAILPDSRYVNLFLNGKYNGLYLLSERKDKKLFKLNDSQPNINSSLIFNSNIANNLSSYQSEYWEQEWPKEEDIKIKDGVIPGLIDFIVNASNEDFFDFETGIYSILNKDNLIDFFIYNFFIAHRDFWNFNYLIIRDSHPAKFFLCPWDFDQCFGQWGVKIFNYGDIQTSYVEGIRKSNEIYNRLLNNTEFKTYCKNRWEQIRQELWTEKYILNLISTYYNEIKEIVYHDLFDFPWNPNTVNDAYPLSFPPNSGKELDLDEYIDHLYQFIPERLDKCDKFFSEW